MENLQSPHGTPPDNYLVWAILSTVFCRWPLGVVSIIKSNKVNTLWYQVDYEGAKKAADDAKKYAIISAVVMPIIFILMYAFLFIIGMAGALADV